ncbi:thioesterase II family protein [Kitasatospora sp. NPDC096204]|uniref:thioesterase II family protein n=1 Tax=Kitasatospora sp. NPDC096204 TaxID=3364094 RepID=UPI00380092B2
MSVSVSQAALWVRRFHPNDDSPTRLVCFPHAGGSASFYFPVSAALADRTDVLCLQYPGRQDRRTEPCVDSIPELADLVHAALAPWADRPTVFFGHSMGAVLAFEVARRQEREGNGPVALFASGRRAPSCVRDETVHLRDDDGIVRELHELSGTDAALLGDEELLRMILPAIRADYTAIETYRPEPDAVIAAPVHVLTGDDDPKTTIDEARAWERHTTGGSDLTVLPGGHFFLAHHQRDINGRIADRLARVSAG